MHRDVRPLIQRLLRGVATDHVATVREAWRGLVAEPAAAVPEVREVLVSPAWAEPPRGPGARYLAVLLALLDALDRSAFAAEIARLRAARLHPAHRRTVDLLARRRGERPLATVGPGVPVHVSPDIADPSAVIASLARWAETPGLALDGVTRIDVIARLPELDYLGCYDLRLSGIVLTWPPGRARGWRLWLRRLDAEYAFYREVGHHAAGHVDGGHVPEQEAEADAFARAMIRAARPAPLGAVSAAVLWRLRRVGHGRP